MTRHRNSADPADVITAFLWDGRRILLALRSERVSTFPKHWAGISGYLESDDAVDWAFVEIAEECGVARSHLTLRGAGPPLLVTDPSSGRAFRVHPLLFFLDDPTLVRHDWEARRFEWVPVTDVLAGTKQPAVPQLYETFESVWPPSPLAVSLESNLMAAIRWLRADRAMGAGRLARAAATELGKLVRLSMEDDFERYRATLADAGRRLGAARASMAAPANLVHDILAEWKSDTTGYATLDLLNEQVSRCQQAEDDTATRAAEVLGTHVRVMTISASGTVLRALQLSGKRIERVDVCEGRPLLEGRQLATRLKEADIPVTLITDAQAFWRMPDVDCVLIGADAVLANGDVINKVGSSLLALAARHFGKQLYVAAAEFKRERAANSVLHVERNPTAEVWDTAPPGIKVDNIYFDRVPSELVSRLITETG